MISTGSANGAVSIVRSRLTRWLAESSVRANTAKFQ